MKKIIASLCFMALLVACNTTPEGYTLNGTISGDIKDSTQVFLKKIGDQNQPLDIDTTLIKNGKFSFTRKSGELELQFIFIDKVNGYVPFIVEDGKIELTAQKDSLNFAKIDGTPQNKFYADFSEGMRLLSNKYNSINTDLKNASSSGDTAAKDALQEELKELIEERKSFEINFIKKNPTALISAFLLQGLAASKKFPEEEVKEMFDALSPEIKETIPGKNIAKSFKKAASVKVGAKAPNFSAPTPSGKKLALNDVLGKVTIIDFWAAWCKPCRAENPNVVNLYNKYHEKGLNILGVSFDKKATDWKKAIEDDGLIWNHVSNVKYFDEIAKLYNIKAIPATIILDEKGVIVAKNLRGEALAAKIATMLQ